MTSIRFRRAGPSDSPALAELNQQLIRDSGHRNPMTVPELQERMRSWLSDDAYEAYLFESDDSTIGYVLHRLESDEAYIRQFFILPAFRRRGYGRRAFEWLVENAWLGRRLRLDVLVGNNSAIAFWHALGFEDYCITMESSGKQKKGSSEDDK